MHAPIKGRSLIRRLILIAMASTVAILAVAPTASAAGDPVRTASASTYTAVPSRVSSTSAVTLKVTNRYADSVKSVPARSPFGTAGNGS